LVGESLPGRKPGASVGQGIPSWPETGLIDCPENPFPVPGHGVGLLPETRIRRQGQMPRRYARKYQSDKRSCPTILKSLFSGRPASRHHSGRFAAACCPVLHTGQRAAAADGLAHGQARAPVRS